MSRAFTRENDGWSYCKEKLESCMYANEYGKCMMTKWSYTIPRILRRERGRRRKGWQ